MSITGEKTYKHTASVNLTAIWASTSRNPKDIHDLLRGSSHAPPPAPCLSFRHERTNGHQAVRQARENGPRPPRNEPARNYSGPGDRTSGTARSRYNGLTTYMGGGKKGRHLEQDYDGLFSYFLSSAFLAFLRLVQFRGSLQTKGGVSFHRGGWKPVVMGCRAPSKNRD
jgi:hypothetical protein